MGATLGNDHFRQWQRVRSTPENPKELLIDFYFAHPYASWERGTNENMNGLIRHYLPKDRDLTTVTAQEEIMIMDRLNLRPRKCLDFSTPFEVFFDRIPVALTT